ncbi:recombinase family protein [Mesorhizobium sp. M0460]
MVAETGKGDVIVVTKLDRMVRSARDGLNTSEDVRDMVFSFTC